MLGIVAFALVIFSSRYTPVLTIEQRALIAPPPYIEKMSFGFSEVIADSLWIRALQDFDYCDQEVAERICRGKSWLFKMLDAVTNLSPNFRVAYSAGALALTVIITDVDGATKIFEKGIAAFPNDWPILYRAAYHYLYELNDKKRAAELLIRAGDNGASPWVYTLAGRLYSDVGSFELAEVVLQDMINTEQDPVLIKRLQDKIESMKKTKPTK